MNAGRHDEAIPTKDVIFGGLKMLCYLVVFVSIAGWVFNVWGYLPTILGIWITAFAYVIIDITSLFFESNDAIVKLLNGPDLQMGGDQPYRTPILKYIVKRRQLNA